MLPFHSNLLAQLLNRGRQSCLKTGCVVSPGLKTGGVLGSKNSTDIAHSVGLRVSSSIFLI